MSSRQAHDDPYRILGKWIAGSLFEGMISALVLIIYTVFALCKALLAPCFRASMLLTMSALLYHLWYLVSLFSHMHGNEICSIILFSLRFTN